MPQLLADKVAVITGAANGLGRALALELHSKGSHLALLDLNTDGLESLRQEISGRRQRISIHPTDISDEAAVSRCREEILTTHGRVDMLVNNAGISISQPFVDIELHDYRRLMEVNFWGTVLCTRHFLPELQKREGFLVNIISDFALMGFPGKTAYASSKSAVMAFTNCLKTELADSSVHISLIIPPPMDTGIVWAGKHVSEEKRTREAAFLKRVGMPLDEAARRIVRAIEHKKYRVVIGRTMWAVDLASRIAPALLHRMIAKRRHRFDFV